MADSRSDGPEGHGVLTLPNLVTAARLAAVPVFLWLLWGRDDPLAAAWLLGALGATDWVDGFLARRLGQVSELGKILDPVADRVVLLVCGGATILEGAVPAPVAVLALGREAVVAVVALTLAAMGARRIDVRWVGKAGTFLLFVAFPLFLAARSGVSWADWARAAAWATAVPGIVLAWWAAAAYVGPAREALAEGRAARSRP